MTSWPALRGALRARADGKQLPVLPLPANDSLPIIDADGEQLIRRVGSVSTDCRRHLRRLARRIRLDARRPQA